MLLANRLRVPAARALRQARAGSRRAAPDGSSARLASTSAPTNGGGASLPVLVAVGAGSVLAGYLLAPRAAPAQAQTVVDAAHAPPPTDSVPSFGSPDDFRKAIDELRAAFGGDGDAVTTDEDVLKSKGFSENDYHPGALHTVVVYPQNTEDVVKVVNISRKYRMPIIPYSGGTSLEGHTRGHKTGGICLDMSSMDKIIEIHEADGDVVLQPGVGYVDLNLELKERGIPLFLPLDPGPGATVGGMFNTGCSGTNAVRYGTARGEWFLNATIVLPSGEVIKTRRRARKSSAGFDTTKLFVGSEGTLGIVTELTVKLAPLLDTTVAVVPFPDVYAATRASTAIVNSGAGIQCIELCDADFMRATNIHGASTTKYEEKDSLYLKFQGPTTRSLEEAADIAERIAREHGATGFRKAASKEEAEDLWMDRKNALWSGIALLSGSKAWSTDVCVPVSRLPDLVLETKADMAKSGITSTVVGHVGDGNFHALLLFRNEKELDVVTGLVHRMVERAIGMDGTCTGEHGVGLGKKEYLTSELGAPTIKFMKLIKRTIDPLGLFNPGKLYPDEDSEKGHIIVADQAYEQAPSGEARKVGDA